MAVAIPTDRNARRAGMFPAGICRKSSPRSGRAAAGVGAAIELQCFRTQEWNIVSCYGAQSIEP
jgi:hypothetical protein